jgi:hypothetical protein
MRWWWWCLLCTRPTHWIEFFSVSSLKQRSAVDILLWHIILILSQPSLFSYSFVLHAKWRNNKYQFYHLWLDQTGHQTHNLPHSNYCMWLIIPPLVERRLYCNHHVRPSVRFSVCSHFRNRYLSFYWKKWFYIWYMALAWWLVPCLPFPGLQHIYFLFTVWLRIFHVCRSENFRNSYLSFYWKKWFYI